MRHLLRAFLAATVVALTVVAPSGAILNGTPDSTHRYVGLLVTVIDGERTPVCSGFLVSSTVFVTAGHCIDDLGGTLPAYVSFDRDFGPSSPLVHGTAVPNPKFASSGHEIAAVVLDAAVGDLGHAILPTEGQLQTVPRSAPLTPVGYGANGFTRGGGKPELEFDLVRRTADARLVKLERGKTALSLRMSNGICFGDSGGPVLLGSSDVVVGINSFVQNARCAGNAFAFRVDTEASLDFLAPLL
jgi:Trypsin